MMISVNTLICIGWKNLSTCSQTYNDIVSLYRSKSLPPLWGSRWRVIYWIHISLSIADQQHCRPSWPLERILRVTEVHLNVTNFASNHWYILSNRFNTNKYKHFCDNLSPDYKKWCSKLGMNASITWFLFFNPR